MRRMCLVLMLVGGMGLVPHFAFSQSGNAAKDKAYQDAMQHLAFRSLGPASMDGRIDAFAVPRHDPNTIYVASATGGVCSAAFAPYRLTKYSPW